MRSSTSALAGLAIAVALLLGPTVATATDAPRVLVVRASPTLYAPRLTLTGEVRAATTGTLAFPMGGRVVSWSRDVGDRVMAGDELARLDSSQQQASLEASNAALAAATAQADQARNQYDRIKELVDLGSATHAALDDATAALRMSEEDVNAANIGVAAAMRALADMVLRAPHDGVVTGRSVEVGQVVQAAEPVLEVAEDGPRIAHFDVQEAALLAMPDKPQIELTLPNTGRRFSGELLSLSPGLDPVTGTVHARIRIESDGDGPPLGATIVGSAGTTPRLALVLPVQTLTIAGGKPAVWVLDPETRAVSAVAVDVLDYAGGSMVLSVDALPAGTQIVVRGPRSLRDGQTVTPETESRS